MIKLKIERIDFDWNGTLRPLRAVDKLVQHHMAHPSWGVQDVHTFHRDSRSWVGIGYNYWISFDGRIFEGRGDKQGAHAQGHNHRTIGVGYQGNFESQEMTDEQVEAGAQLNAKLIEEYGLTVEDIIGHEDVGDTSCPGVNFRMNELRQRTKEILEGDDMLEKAVVYHGDADRDIAGQLAEYLGCVSVYRGVAENMGKFAKVLYIAGGGEGNLQADSFVDLSGANRWESFKRISEYML